MNLGNKWVPDEAFHIMLALGLLLAIGFLVLTYYDRRYKRAKNLEKEAERLKGPRKMARKKR